MVLERRMVDGLPYYYLVRYRSPAERRESKNPARRESKAYIGRLTGVELDRWIRKLQRWRALVDDEGRPKTKRKQPASRT